ncbi:MAG: hypothetical protein ACRCZ0_08640 [Cetobacterium sp.]
MFKWILKKYNRNEVKIDEHLKDDGTISRIIIQFSGDIACRRSVLTGASIRDLDVYTSYYAFMYRAEGFWLIYSKISPKNVINLHKKVFIY